MSDGKTISNVSAQLMTFPKNGIRKQGAKSGRWVLDFVNALATDKDGNSEEISNSLVKIGSQFARSVFITVSTVDALIKIGQNTLPKSHQLTYVINGIGFEDITIEFPVDRTPLDDFSFLVIASDASIFPIDADVLIGQHNPTPQTGTTVDADVVIFDFLFTGFNQLQLVIENTGGTNGLTATVEVSEDGTNFVASQGFPVNIPFGDFNIFQNSINHKFISVKVKAQVPASQTTFRIQANLER